MPSLIRIITLGCCLCLEIRVFILFNVCIGWLRLLFVNYFWLILRETWENERHLTHHISSTFIKRTENLLHKMSGFQTVTPRLLQQLRSGRSSASCNWVFVLSNVYIYKGIESNSRLQHAWTWSALARPHRRLCFLPGEFFRHVRPIALSCSQVKFQLAFLKMFWFYCTSLKFRKLKLPGFVESLYSSHLFVSE